MKSRQDHSKLKHFASLEVTKGGVKVGDLYREEGRGIFFTYAPQWLATGFNLSPFTMKFDDKPQLASAPDLFEGCTRRLQSDHSCSPLLRQAPG